eukprot:CAMPEP_0172518644 /NCGR_PEP_ID=MMETSP1066-20121228/290940_1 /TAXON_ID=671091 /ORGANISM="Coscinodiscus wailesii, Strain CCMP2513" /LENGTH=93 /DNA_ID=CAMNT_0013301071 /DNA_START=703 /DNA_END=984 /DNA_ORIENTATION=-
MAKAGIDVIAYDVDTDGGGTIAKTKTDADGTAAADNTSSHVVAIRQGGPECLKEHSDRALFLCYQDEDFYESIDFPCNEAGGIRNLLCYGDTI